MAQVACERLLTKRGELIVAPRTTDFTGNNGGGKGKDRAQKALTSSAPTCPLMKSADQCKADLRNFLRPRLRGLLEATLGDSREINEIRAEIATLRSEIIELKSSPLES